MQLSVWHAITDEPHTNEETNKTIVVPGIGFVVNDLWQNFGSVLMSIQVQMMENNNSTQSTQENNPPHQKDIHTKLLGGILSCDIFMRWRTFSARFTQFFPQDWQSSLHQIELGHDDIND